MSKEQTLEQEIRELNRVAQKESAHTVPLEDSFVDAVCCFIRSKLKSETEKAWNHSRNFANASYMSPGFNEELKQNFLSQYDTP